MSKLACPKCGKKLAVAAAVAGRRVRCPSCSETFSVPETKKAVTPPPQPRAPKKAASDEGVEEVFQDAGIRLQPDERPVRSRPVWTPVVEYDDRVSRRNRFLWMTAIVVGIGGLTFGAWAVSLALSRQRELVSRPVDEPALAQRPSPNAPGARVRGAPNPNRPPQASGKALARAPVPEKPPELTPAQRAIDQSFQQALDTMGVRLQGFEAALAAEPPEVARLEDPLRRLEVEADGFDVKAAMTSASLQESWKAMAARLHAARKNLQGQREAPHLESEVTEALTHGVEEYASALEKYVAACGQTRRGAAFSTSLREAKHWKAVSDWNGLLAAGGSNALPLSAEAAQDPARKCQALVSGNPGFVDAPAAKQYLLCVNAIAERNEENAGGAAAALRKLFADPLVGKLWMLTTTNGKKYYLTKDVSEAVQSARYRSESVVSISHIVNGEGAERPHPLQTQVISEIVRAPQSLLADYVKGLPKNFGGRAWETTVLSVMAKLQADKEMDPILRLALLKQVVDLGAKGSYPLAAELKKACQSIDGAHLDASVAWMDPGVDLSEARNKAQQVVEQIPSLQPLAAKAANAQSAIERTIVATHCQVAGWLARERTGAWVCRSAMPLNGKYRLFVVVPAGERTQWREVGQRMDDRTMITADNDVLQEGRIVFARTSD